jgi:integrase
LSRDPTSTKNRSRLDAAREAAALLPDADRVSGHVSVRKGKRGDVFYAKYRLPDGRQVQRRLGPAWAGPGRPPSGFYTQRTAELALAAIVTDARRGTLPGMRRTGATFADAAAEFLRYVEQVRQRQPSTVRDYRYVIDGYLLPAFGERRLETITADEIDAYKERLLASGKLSNRSIVRHLMVLHGIFRRAARVWKLPVNPASADLVERPPVRYSGDFELLSPDQVFALARAADPPQDGALYITAAFTGLRLGELLALRWRDVDWGLQRIQVQRNYTDGREKEPKSGRVRSAPMVDEVLAALDELSRREHFTRANDLVFCSVTGEHLEAWGMRRRFYDALERAGLPRIVFHDLRHCFASLAVQKLPLSTVQGYLGHAHISTTMRYVHHTPASEDVALLSAAIRGEGGEADQPAHIRGARA